jgi:hypothetical protein
MVSSSGYGIVMIVVWYGMIQGELASVRCQTVVHAGPGVGGWLGINDETASASALHHEKKPVKASDRDKTRHTAGLHVSSVAQNQYPRPAQQDRPRSTPLSGGMACQGAWSLVSALSKRLRASHPRQ